MASSATASPTVQAPRQQRRFRLRTETARERDVFRHLHPWMAEHRQASLDRQAFLTDDQLPMSSPTLCPDTALLAFAQLCALRMRARRCFVTLISSHVEYVLAESTQTMSLQYAMADDARDRPWLGTCSFLRDEGLSAEHIDAWRRARQAREDPDDSGYFYTDGSSPHWHVVSDMRDHDEYAQRSFVKRNPGLRFYAAIPLRGAFGSVIGSLAIVDDIPRYGISTAELSFMEDVADTITQHLDATVVRSQRQRSERMIQSLGLFNNGKSSLRSWWLKQEDRRKANTGRRETKELTALERSDAVNQEFGLKAGSSSDRDTSSSSEAHEALEFEGDESDRPSTVTATTTSLENARAKATQESEGISIHDFRSRRSARPMSRPPNLLPMDSIEVAPKKQKTLKSPHTSSARTSAKHGANNEFDLAMACKDTYARASNLIRESLSADGVVFVNAGAAASKNPHTTNSELSSVSDLSVHQLSSEDNVSEVSSSGTRHAAIHAFSSKEQSSLRGFESLSNRFEISESFLNTLIKRYPYGRIFNFKQDGAACSSSNEDSATPGTASNSDGLKSKYKRLPRDAKRLGEIMAGAKTIAFYPIWDESQNRFCSCVFVWCSSPLRYFDPTEDITYLVAWSHSVLAELRRSETIAADKAKGTFISSVSHELRSPLHGVLAGVEFLEESELTTFQQEMVQNISMAGRMLLDTISHILDYAKMSNFTRAERGIHSKTNVTGGIRSFPQFSGGSSERRIENSVNLAHLTEQVVETMVLAHRSQNGCQSDAHDLSIVINIPWRESWNVKLSPGGWTRIVQNLVGNALKYTRQGLVSVRMTVGDPKFRDGKGSQSAQEFWPIRFVVQDTGIGIGEHFLATGLYTPFQQEDSYSTGTGLGLSIVRQICRDMGAKLNVTSELGTGTKATVDFEVQFMMDSTTSQSGSIESAKTRNGAERELKVEHYHWIVPGTHGDANDDNPNGAASDPSSDGVGSSVLENAKEWLNCESSQGVTSIVAPNAGPWIYAITEDHLLQWVRNSPDILEESLADLPKASTHVLVLGKSLWSVSSSILLEKLPFIPVFVHQPIGPRKLIRAIASDHSSTLLGTVVSPVGDENGSDEPRRMSLAHSPDGKQYVSNSPLHRTDTNRNAWKPSLAQILSERKDGVESSPSVTTENSSSKETVPSALAISNDTSRSIASAQPSGSWSAKSSMISKTLDVSIDDEEGMEPEIEAQKREKVLLVEDNEVNMKLLVALMRKQKLPFECAINGREAVEIYRARPLSFFLILMDISMPIMDGFTATTKIRETEHKGRIPKSFVAALTGVTSDDAKGRAFDSGVDVFLSKPVHMKEVKKLVVTAKEEVETREQASRPL